MAASRGGGDDGPAPPARFAFNHQRGRDHSLWYYGDERHSLSVSDLSVRQLLYACDYNGHNPLHVFLAGGEEPPNLKEQLAASKWGLRGAAEGAGGRVRRRVLPEDG